MLSANKACGVTTVTDPYYSSVSLLLPMSANFTDYSSSPKTISNTNATISSAQYVFPPASGYFSGSGAYLSYQSPGVKPSVIDFVLDTTSTGTIEFWVFVPGLANNSILSIGECYWNFGLTSGGNLSLYWWTGSANTITYTSGITSNTWVYIAFVKSTNVVQIFVNGISKGSQNVTSVSWGTAAYGDTLRIGHTAGISVSDLNGYLSNLRITKGVARYTSDFTPPTAPFPTS